MRISQADFRTIQIAKGSVSCRLRYNLYQDGEIRYPESISCRADTVVAYFLTSTIRDFIAETAHGFCIERHWNIVPEGSYGLSFCVEFPAEAKMAYLFPGLHAGRSDPETSYLAAGERTCYANGLYLFRDPESVLIFSDPPASIREAGSIELQYLRNEEGADTLRAELRVPAASAAVPKKRTRRDSGGAQFFRSDGQFEYDLRLNIVTAARGQIQRRGLGAVLERNTTGLHPPPNLPTVQTRDVIEDQIAECLSMFLTDRDPVCGLLETKEEKKISSLAGCTLALIQLRFLPEDRDAVELSRRMADFALKGQHPRGLFYPYYWTDRRSWLPPDPTITVALDQSAAVALMLLRSAALLHSRGFPASSYLHAATHMADSLLSSNQDMEALSDLLYPDSLLSAGPPVRSPQLIELFLELHRVSGKDAYRKAARTLQSGLFARQSEPPLLPGLDGSGADIDSLLLHAQAAVLLDESGYPVKELHHYFDALLSRVYLNRPDPESEFNPVGGVNRALGDTTLLFRGFELSHTLLKLNERMKKTIRLGELDLLVSQLLGFTLQKPMGTSFFDPPKKGSDRYGPANSRLWMRELHHMTRLLEEFPGIIPGPKQRTPAGPAESRALRRSQ
jgi:hypothetical protein